MSLLAIAPPPSTSGIKTTLTNDTVSYPVVTLHVPVYWPGSDVSRENTRQSQKPMCALVSACMCKYACESVWISVCGKGAWQKHWWWHTFRAAWTFLPLWIMFLWGQNLCSQGCMRFLLDCVFVFVPWCIRVRACMCGQVAFVLSPQACCQWLMCCLYRSLMHWGGSIHCSHSDLNQ